LPREKPFSSFERGHLPLPVARRLEILLQEDFLSNRENILVFGNPGSGKTHLLCGWKLQSSDEMEEDVNTLRQIHFAFPGTVNQHESCVIPLKDP